MSSLFEFLRKFLKNDKNFRNQPLYKYDSNCWSDKLEKKDIYKDRDQQQTQFSQSSFSQTKAIYKGQVKRIIGKSQLESSQFGNFTFYLVKWKDKLWQQSTWQLFQKLQHEKQKIKQFDESIKGKNLPFFKYKYIQYQPDYLTILQKFLKEFKKTKRKLKKQKQESNEKTYLKFKKITKRNEKKPYKNKRKRIKLTEREEKFYKKGNKDIQERIRYQKKYQDKIIHWTRSYTKDYYEIMEKKHRKKREKKNKSSCQSFKKLFKLNLQKQNRLEKNERQLQEKFLKSNISIITPLEINEMNKELLQNDENQVSTNFQTDTGQELIFLSDTYRHDGAGQKIIEKQEQKDNKNIVLQINSSKDQQEQMQPGEMFIDTYSFKYERQSEIQEGEFTESELKNLTFNR